MFTLDQVVSWFDGCRVVGRPPESFTELIVEAFDAETPGWLYVPVVNALFDGREALSDAIAAGARAVVVDEDWFGSHPCPLPAFVVPSNAYQTMVKKIQAKRDSFNGDVFAITGSCGKTTTKEILAAFLRGAGKVCASSETINHGGGQCEILLKVRDADRYVVSEVGIYGPSQMRHSCRLLRPSAAILTSIGTAHIGGFRSQEHLARSKARIFDKLWGTNQFGVISREMAYYGLVRDMAKCRLVEVSLEDASAPFWGTVLDEQSGVMRVTERDTGIQTEMRIGRPGRHICQDALLAYAAARTVGVSPAQCLEGLKTLSIPGARWKTFVRNGVTYIDDSYNACTTAMNAVLDIVNGLKGRRIVVFGDIIQTGNAAEAMHRAVGRKAAMTALEEFVTYGELSSSFMADEYDSCASRHKAIRTRSMAELRETLSRMVRPGDTVVLKASGRMRLSEAIAE